MDIFTQKKVLIRIVILLLILNLCSVGVFLWKGITHPGKQEEPGNKDDKEVSAILQRELKLTVQQTEVIKKLRSGFFEKENLLVVQIRAERDSMNVLMFNDKINGDQVKSLARRVADNEYKMEMLRYEQSQEFKKICTPDQLKKFETLVVEIRDYFKPNGPPKNDNEPPKRRKHD